MDIFGEDGCKVCIHCLTAERYMCSPGLHITINSFTHKKIYNTNFNKKINLHLFLKKCFYILPDIILYYKID